MVLCLIVGCGNQTGKIRTTAENVSSFRVHVLLSVLSTKEELTAERRRRWILFTDSILENDRDCSKHFVPGEPAKDWYRFNVDWLPTLCLGHSKQQVQVKDPETAEAGTRRAAERRKRRSELLENTIKDKMLKIDEPEETIEEMPFSEQAGLGENLEQDGATDARASQQ